MADHPIAVFIADDCPVFRSGLRHLIQTDHDLTLVGETGDGEQAIELARKIQPEVVLLDAQMPKLTATRALEQLAAIPLDSKILLMSDNMEREHLIRALHSGARGLVAKNADGSVFLKAIRCVHKGELWVERDILGEWASTRVRGNQARFRLTSREREIVGEIMAGSSNREIASKFFISEYTVKRHLTNIYDKLGCSTRLELSLFAMHHELLA